MPQFITRPARGLAATQFISLLQQQRRQDEEDRQKERDRQERDTIIAAGLVLGAVGGFALAPAATGVASAASGVGVITATGAVGTTALQAALPSVLAGASFGGKIAGGFTGGDVGGGVANAVGLASKAVQKFQKAQDNMAVFGFQPTKEETSAFLKSMTKLNMNPGEARRIARTTGALVPQQIQEEAINQASDDALAKMAADANLFELPGEIRAGAEGAGLSIAEYFQARGQQQDEQDIKNAAQKAYEVRRATTLAGQHDVTAFAKMQDQIGPAGQQQITAAAAEIQETERMLQAGDIDLTQATTRMIGTAKKFPKPLPLPSTELPPLQQIVPGEVATVPVTTTDGMILGHQQIIRLPRTSQNPDGTFIKGAFIAKKDSLPPDASFADLWGTLEPADRSQMIADELKLMTVIGAEPVTAAEALRRIEEAHNAGLDLMRRVTQPQSPQVDSQQLFDQLSQMVKQKPVERWSPQEFEQAKQVLDAIEAEITSSGRSDPETRAMLEQVIQFSEIINVQRDR